MDAVRLASTAPTAEVEVVSKAQRRQYSAEYKRRIVAEAAACAGERGAVGALLRREGLYASHLMKWRQQAEEGQVEALSKKRGPKPKVIDERDRRIAELERELAKQRLELEKAHDIIEIQKKLSRILGITLPPPPPRRDEEDEP